MEIDEKLKSQERDWIATLVARQREARILAAKRQLQARDKLIEQYVQKHGLTFNVRQYNPGDMVMIKDHQIDTQLNDTIDTIRDAQQSLGGARQLKRDLQDLEQLNPEWGPKYIGPYRVLRKIGTTSYK